MYQIILSTMLSIVLATNLFAKIALVISILCKSMFHVSDRFHNFAA